jgi:hypothetical protein
MMTKSLALFSASLVLIAVSTAAHAGSTISDRSYWPSETRSGWTPPGPFAAFDAIPGPRQGSFGYPPSYDAARNYRYHGGPKSSY